MAAKQGIKPGTVYTVRGTELTSPYPVRTDPELEWSHGKVWVTEGFFLQPGNEWRDYGNSRQRISPVRLTEVK